MRNHDHKNRDMARSILPSTRRSTARERKKGSTRRARARNKARLSRLMAYADDPDGFEEPLDRYDLDDYSTWGMVGDRREADKVAPLLRWAEARIARTPSLREGDYWTRRNYFAAILGDTLAGRHALSHLEYVIGGANPHEYGYDHTRRRWEERRERDRREATANAARRTRQLEDVLSGADAERLNARIKTMTPPVQQHWAIDDDGRRVPAGRSGYEPWLFEGDRNAWLTIDRSHIRGLERVDARRGPTASAAILLAESNTAQEIAFHALASVHAEMFPLLSRVRSDAE